MKEGKRQGPAGMIHRQLGVLLLLGAIESVWHSFVILRFHPLAGLFLACILLLPLRYEWPRIYTNFTYGFSFHSTSRLTLVYSLKTIVWICACQLWLGPEYGYYAIKSSANILLVTAIAILANTTAGMCALAVLNAWTFYVIMDSQMDRDVEMTTLHLWDCLRSYLLQGLLLSLQCAAANDTQKAWKEVWSDFPSAVVVLNRAGQIRFKSQELFDLLGTSRNVDKAFADLTLQLQECTRSKVTLKANIEQFWKDIEVPYEQKMQWTQDYFMIEPMRIESSTNLMTIPTREKKCMKVTMMSTRTRLIPDISLATIYQPHEPELLLFLKDVTDRGALKEQKKADSMKSALISTMSHELRTPLHGILGILDMTAEKLPTARQRWWRAAHVSARLLLNTVNCMLDYSQLETREFALQPASLNIRLLFAELLSTFDCIVPKERVQLRAEVNPDVPAVVNTDPKRVKQVLTSLLANAVNLTSKGSIDLQATNHGNNSIRFEVRDTGVGIPRKTLRHLFTLFSNPASFPTASTGPQPASLGLTVSNRLVMELGGTLDVQSTVNVGSTFSFSIKCISESVVQESAKLILPDPLRRSVEMPPKERLNAVRLRLKFPVDLRRQTAQNLLSLKKQKSGKPRPPGCSPPRRGNVDTTHLPSELLASLRRHQGRGGEGRWDTEAQKEGEADGDSASSESSNEESLFSFQDGSVCDELHTANDIEESVKFIQRSVSGWRFSLTSESPSIKSLSEETRQQRRKPSCPAEAAVLIVDDNPINRLVLGEMLRSLGFQPSEACHGVEACQLVLSSGQPYDLVLMDVNMPLMDGIEATTEIRGRFGPNDLPIVAVTAQSTDSVMLQCREAGMNDALAKPLSMQDLQNILRRYALLPSENLSP